MTEEQIKTEQPELISSLESKIETFTIKAPMSENDAHILKEAQEFLASRYTSDKVLPYKSAKTELSDTANEAYTWLVAKNGHGQVVGTVVFDVWPVPRSPINEKLISDGKTHYTALYYATAVEGYENALKSLIEEAMKKAKEYSESKNKKNVGILTDDLSNEEVLKQLGGKYLVELGVPTLEGITDEEYLTKNFEAAGHEKIMVIPFTKKGWTKSLAKRVVGSYLDEGYNEKGPGDKGYKPLTTAPYFKEFSEKIDTKNSGRYVTSTENQLKNG